MIDSDTVVSLPKVYIMQTVVEFNLNMNVAVSPFALNSWNAPRLGGAKASSPKATCRKPFSPIESSAVDHACSINFPMFKFQNWTR